MDSGLKLKISLPRKSHDLSFVHRHGAPDVSKEGWSSFPLPVKRARTGKCARGLLPLKWSDPKYGFDHGGGWEHHLLACSIAPTCREQFLLGEKLYSTYVGETV